MSIHPIPKPTRETRPTTHVTTHGLKYAKQPPDRSDAYRKFVRAHTCALVGSVTDCGGRTEHAHLITAGRGLKGSDFLSVPLCTRHHGEQHSVGIDYFQTVNFINLWRVAAELMAEWIRSER